MDKEKLERDMYIKVQPSLYEQFRECCNMQFKTVSVVIRELMLRYTEEHPCNNNGKEK